MKPIYFPSTYVSDSVAQALTACFGQFIVYQPLSGKLPESMCPWVEKGMLDIRIPEISDQEEFEAVVKNYQNWADLHYNGAGLKFPFLRTWTDSIPFFSATSTSQVMADIKKQVRGNSAAKTAEPLLAARLFLYFAQEFDRQNQAVAQDLKRHHQQETELFRQLKMENDTLSAEFQIEQTYIPDDSAEYMMADRLEAWTRIFLADLDISGTFITQIPSVFEYLLDKTPTAEKLVDLDGIPICKDPMPEWVSWQQKLVSGLAQIVENQWSPTAIRLPDQPGHPAKGKTLSIRVFLAVGENPRGFFSRSAQVQPFDSDSLDVGDKFKNTIVGLIESN
jgi:hypothetical protein